MNNCDYFNVSKNNPEPLFDSFYEKSKLVIPRDEKTDNRLTENNAKLIDNITTFKCLTAKGYTLTDAVVLDVVKDIVDILRTTEHINYSAFSQFFMVHNSTYNYFFDLTYEKAITYIYEMLLKYCEERHDMYMRHGYSNVVLQVMCDNYSHKRKSKASIDKTLSILNPYGLKRISRLSETDGVNYYFLPDKGDKKLFEEFIQKYNLKMESRAIEQNKLPDIVFNCNGEFYICELKTMKGSGGGQNKQIVEVAYFIKFEEADTRFHYVAFLDGDYANILFESTMPKIVQQREDISQALQNNPNNYFVNTAGFKQLVTDIFKTP